MTGFEALKNNSGVLRTALRYCFYNYSYLKHTFDFFVKCAFGL